MMPTSGAYQSKVPSVDRLRRGESFAYGFLTKTCMFLSLYQCEHILTQQQLMLGIKILYDVVLIGSYLAHKALCTII